MPLKDFRVSVIMPVYNAESYLRKAVESAEVLEEVYEIILVEDKSPDNAYELALMLEKEYHKVKVFQHPDGQNHGAGASRNLGIKKATGEYIAFLDADDYYLKNRFKKDKELFKSIVDCDGVYNCVATYFYSEEAKRNFFDKGLGYQEQLTLTDAVLPNELFAVLFNQHPDVSGQFCTDGITLKRTVFDKVGFFNIDLRLRQDIHLWRRLAGFCNLYSGELSKPVAMRGIHDSNRMTKVEDHQQYLDLWWNSLEKEFRTKKLNSYNFDIFSQAYYNHYTGSKNKFNAFYSLFLNTMKKPKIITKSNGHFDFNFWKVFGRNCVTLHLISAKNRFLGILKKLYRVVIRTKHHTMLKINSGFNEIKVPKQAIYLRQKFFQSLGYPTILVYTMGKVGSTSLYNGLKTNKLFLPLIYHIHFLTRINLDEINAKYKQAGQLDNKSVLLKDLIKGNFRHEEASDALLRIKPNKKWILISMVRDPIDTFFSHIFQNPKVHRPQILSEDGKIDPEKVQNYINEYTGKYTPEKDFISNWFSSEFNEYINMDIYEYPFDHEKEYLLLKTDALNIVVFKLNVLEKKVGNVLTELLGKKIVIKLGRDNDRETSTNGTIYSQIKKDIIFERSFLEQLYSTQFANYFFNEETRKKKIEYWCNPRQNT